MTVPDAERRGIFLSSSGLTRGSNLKIISGFPLKETIARLRQVRLDFAGMTIVTPQAAGNQTLKEINGCDLRRVYCYTIPYESINLLFY